MKWLPLFCLLLLSCTDNQTPTNTSNQPRPDIEPILEVPAAPGYASIGSQVPNSSQSTAIEPGLYTGGPKITFEKVRYNFGEIYHADKVDHQFNFTNTGSGDLEIKSVKVSCGCTTPTYSLLPIAPGEKGFIGVKYNSVGKQGAQKATIRVATNDPENPEVKLYLSGRVLVKPKKENEE